MITSAYAAVAAVGLVVLSARVIARRRAHRVGLGDGGVPALQRAIRVQGNFVEYAFPGLLLMALAEIGGASPWSIHAIGLLLLAGRLIHAVGVGREPEPTALRVAGMVATFTALLSAAAANLAVAM